MPSLLTVNNNVSLLTVNIAPSTFLASLTLSLVFLSLYLPALRLPTSHIPGLSRLGRGGGLRGAGRKPLPPVPEVDLLQDLPLVIDDRSALVFHGQYQLREEEEEELEEELQRLQRQQQKQQQGPIREMTATSPPDHLDASLQDFEPPSSPRPGFAYPSYHSDFLSRAREDDVESLGGETESSVGDYSPPAWRRLGNGDRCSGFWRGEGPGDDCGLGAGDGKAALLMGGGPFMPRVGDGDDRLYRGRRMMMSPSVSSRGSSPDGYESADEDILEQAMRTRLPTGSLSPERDGDDDEARFFSPYPEPGRDHDHPSAAATTIKVEPEDDDADSQGPITAPAFKGDPLDYVVKGERGGSEMLPSGPQDASDNYFRFAVRAEVQQRTEPIENAIRFVRAKHRSMTATWARIFASLALCLLSLAAMRFLFGPTEPRPVPDLVKVAGVARAFEPLIYYSESGARQIRELQSTGVAVWDLGESVRSSNMTSAPIIVRELDELVESLTSLSVELTKFFSNVDGDIDSILIVMDWARRELSHLQQSQTQPLTLAFDNIHNLLSKAGVLEDRATGQPTRAGELAMAVFGLSSPQRKRLALGRAFNEFLAVLEEAIESELQHSLVLFAMFESVDRQFLNLARTVARESSAQEEEHSDLLSSLWTRLLGARRSEVAKYERNRGLLRNVRERTVRNKSVLVRHNHRLLALKASLEGLRRRLVSPLVRSVNSSVLSLEEQIKGLEDAGGHLEAVRARQKGRLMDALFGGIGGGGGVDGNRIVEESRMIDDIPL